jgi:hypothetical protein
MTNDKMYVCIAAGRMLGRAGTAGGLGALVFGRGRGVYS